MCARLFWIVGGGERLWGMRGGGMVDGGTDGVSGGRAGDGGWASTRARRDASMGAGWGCGRARAAIRRDAGGNWTTAVEKYVCSVD